MPIYEYRGLDCNVVFEMLVRAGTVVTCPHQCDTPPCSAGGECGRG